MFCILHILFLTRLLGEGLSLFVYVCMCGYVVPCMNADSLLLRCQLWGGGLGVLAPSIPPHPILDWLGNIRWRLEISWCPRYGQTVRMRENYFPPQALKGSYEGIKIWHMLISCEMSTAIYCWGIIYSTTRECRGQSREEAYSLKVGMYADCFYGK